MKLTPAFAIAACLAYGGCATIGAVSSGQTITPADVQNDAITICGFLPTAETASNLIQADTQTAGSNTATTDAQRTALAEQLAQLACAVAKGSATAPAKSLRGLRLGVAPNVAIVGNVSVPIVGQFVK